MPNRPDLPTLLRDAVPPPPPVDLVDLRRRATKLRRRRRGFSALAAATVVAVAVVGAAALQPSPPESSVTTATDPPAVPAEVLERLPLDARTVTSAPDGSLWALAPAPTGGVAVHQVDPVSGKSIRSIEINGPASFLEFGLGHLWVGGGGDGAEPDGRLAVIEPTTGTIIAEEEVESGGPYGFAFSDDAAWITTGAAGDVWRITFDRSPLRRESLHLGGQTNNIVVLENGQVWVHEYIGRRVVRVDPARVEIGEQLAWAGIPLTRSGGSRAWALDPEGRVVEVDLAKIEESGAPAVVQTVPTSMRFPAVEAVGDHLWVHRDGIERWALPIQPGAVPVTTNGRDVYSLTEVGGTAWFVAGGGSGGLWRWRPPAPPAVTSNPLTTAEDSRAGKLLVFLHNEASADDLDQIREQLERHPATRGITYLDHAAAHAEFAQMFKDQPDLVRRTTPEELPRSFQVVPSSVASANAIAQAVKGLPGVKELVCPTGRPCEP
jgi:streptogramin lyase